MATYITLGNWTEQGIRGIKDLPKRVDAARQMMKEAGAEMRGYYVTLGAYDFVAIIEAPSDEVATRVLLSIASLGNVRTTTLKAFDEAAARNIIRSLG